MEKCIGFKDNRIKSFSLIYDFPDGFPLSHTCTEPGYSELSLMLNPQLEYSADTAA